MAILNVSELTEGMITLAPIVTKRGQSIAKEGTVLTDQLISKLTFYKIETVDVDIPEPEPDIFLDSEPEPEPLPQKEVMSDSISYMQRLKTSPKFQMFQSDYALNIEYLKENFEAIIAGAGDECADMLLENVETLFRSKTSLELFDMLHLMRSVDDTIFAHSLNVALTSRAIGKWLKLPKEDLNVLTVAGVLHDIGKTQIPEEVLNKPGKYTDEEWEMVKSHPLQGKSILADKGFDPRIIKAALQHHERFDGSGYPRGLFGDEIDDFAAIIAIADVYDAMTAARSYREPLCSFQVIAEFEKEGIKKYNTSYILTFLERIANTYNNSRVILSNGKPGRVVYINKHSLSRPVIELDGGEILDLSNPKNSDISIKSML
ncbi:MAG: HD-GYP domain-containing protein [Bacteroidaceae bacterium]|nr:HD-GYP domain-containing protein [Bacteroidaceae bacterium]